MLKFGKRNDDTEDLFASDENFSSFYAIEFFQNLWYIFINLWKQNLKLTKK